MTSSDDDRASPRDFSISKKDDGFVEMRLSVRAASSLCQCLNEIVNGVDIDDSELETRVGMDRETLRIMLKLFVSEIRRESH